VTIPTPPEPVSLSDRDVTLRPWRVEDAPILVERINDPAIAEFMDGVPQPYSLSDADDFIGRSREGWLSGGTTNFAIVVDGTEGATGGLGVHWQDRVDGVAEIGYWTAAEARGRGIATTATRLAARWAFKAAPDLERLQLRADEQNVASNRVAEKAGFTREGVLRRARLDRDGDARDMVVFSLVRDAP
jgi:RimJ/RimL family protein N-acetyltransferase